MSRSGISSLVLLAGLASGATANEPAPIGDNRAAEESTAVASPRYAWKLDAPLLLVGATLGLAASSMNTDVQSVPREGLNPADIRFGFDRRALGETVRGNSLSNRTRDLALTFPILLRLASGRGKSRWTDPLRLSVSYFEAMSLAEGITGVTKRAAGRPRPYTYQADPTRSSEPPYDVNNEAAFQSFPSGHATAAWCAVSVGICDHLLSRPAASWKEHALVGLIGGTLGAATAGLRVEAGQHFPSDVVAGSAIGLVSGSAVTLLHRYIRGDSRAPLPPRRSWIAAIAGTAAGIGVGAIAAETWGD